MLMINGTKIICINRVIRGSRLVGPIPSGINSPVESTDLYVWFFILKGFNFLLHHVYNIFDSYLVWFSLNLNKREN